MDIKKVLYLTISGICLSGVTRAQSDSNGDPLFWRQLLKSDEAAQVAWIRATVNQGLPIDRGGTLNMLVLNKSAITLPLIERKIEEVLRSPSPSDCFTVRGVDAQRFVTLAALTITDAGDEHALREVSKLLRVDPTRFDDLVERTLGHAENYRNPFTMSYRGIDIGDSAIDKRIVAWTESQFRTKSEGRVTDLKHLWAEAMVSKYGHPPTTQEWAQDPIFSRMAGAQVKAIHDDIGRFAAEIVEKRSKPDPMVPIKR